MKVKLLTLSAGPGGVIQPGQVVDLPKAMAQALIDGGFAVATGGSGVRVQTSIERESAESAAIQPAENAARPPAAKRKKR